MFEQNTEIIELSMVTFAFASIVFIVSCVFV
jgi:hypothetical protein